MTEPQATTLPPKNYRLGVALILYLGSLGFAGLHLVDGDTVKGWHLLLWGWYGILILQIPWLANLLFFPAITSAARGRFKSAGLFGGAAFMVGLLSLRSSIWMTGHTPIDKLGPGFYMWMAAFLVMASFALLIKANGTP